MQAYTKNSADTKILMLIVGLLIITGFLAIYSASSVYALEHFGDATYYLKRQALGIALGLIAFVVARLTPLSFIKKVTPLLFFGSLGLTALTMIPHLSQSIHGSSRWIHIAGITFQPSEILKVAFLMYLAYFLAKRTAMQSSFIHGYLPFLIILGSTSVILLKQPDFGLTITLAATAFTVLFIAQFQPRHVLITFIALIPLAISLVALKPYRLKRILTFLNPWADPQGAGFQIIQSLIAIGSGSFWGLGIGNSKQKFFYLPMQHTDFIFSIFAEETGFIGSLLLIVLYGAFAYLGLRIASKLTDPFSRFTTLGFVIFTSLQAIINLAVTTGLVPTKGIGLPFISYGNSSLICSFCMLGLIINMAHENRVKIG